MTFTIAMFRSDDKRQLRAARHIREEVFCHEQGVSAAVEWDGKDDLCTHLLLYDGAQPIGTARARLVGPATLKIERVAVLPKDRRTGAGAALMRHFMDALTTFAPGPMPCVVIHAQASAEAFYAGLGYVVEGEPFEEAGIAHLAMRWTPKPRGA